MLTLITSNSCSSSRKVVAWLKDYNIPFVEKKMHELNFEDLKNILILTDRGTPELEVRESSSAKEKGEWAKIHKAVMEAPNLEYLIGIIQHHPRHFKTPILFTKNKLSFGYNDNELRSFISRDKRRIMREISSVFEEK